MRMTIRLDDKIVEEARELTGIHGISALVRAGLEALIQREAALRLAALGGSQPRFRPGRRRRPS
jgi:hypothetical protein